MEAHDGTFSRVRILVALIQDEIMELFIGKSSYFSVERVQYDRPHSPTFRPTNEFSVLSKLVRSKLSRLSHIWHISPKRSF